MTRRTLLAGLCLLLAACGGGDAGDQSGDGGDRDVDVCSLLSAEEAERWLGAPVDSVGPSTAPGAEDTSCLYENTIDSYRMLVTVLDGDQYFPEEGSPARGPDTIENLGDDAHSDSDSVQFFQNGFAVGVAQISGPISVGDLIDVAKLISPRLP